MRGWLPYIMRPRRPAEVHVRLGYERGNLEEMNMPLFQRGNIQTES